MLSKSTIQRIVPILKKDLRRALRIRVPGFPRAYYTSFLLRDTEWFNTWASSGSMYRRRSDHTRNVYCDVRVGSYRYDQSTEGGIREHQEDLESTNHVSVPIDDRWYNGLRLALWRLTDAKYREALVDFKNKEAARLSMVDLAADYPSFVKLKPVHSVRYESPEEVDEEWWVDFCKEMSQWMSALPHVSTAWVEFDASHMSRIFVNTEGSVIVQHQQLYSLDATFRKVGRDGATQEQGLVLNCASQQELPNRARFKEIMKEKYEKLMRLSKSRKIHSFSGPVLLCPDPAAVFFHETIGHRMEGSRLLSSSEGQTFRDLAGTKLMSIDITMRDNPRLKKWGERRCIGAYDFDDEGTPAQDTVLIRDGVLVDYLNTRAALSKRGHRPNGHARNRKYELPISRMAVTIVQGKHPVSMDRLRQLFLEEIRKQGKPYGLIVYETSGGETETATYNFQAFSGEVSYAALVHPDGREVPIRGVNFVGTPLQSLSNIVAVGDTPELHNDYCGAESGFIPISTIAPAVLLSNLELQAKDDEVVSHSIIPRPEL